MKNIVLTCVGLLGLSVAGGAALFASHAAMAAGPQLPDPMVRTDAVEASTDVHGNAAYASDTVVVSDKGVMPFISTQSVDGLAPYRALRPIARPSAYESIAQASSAAPLQPAEVTSNRRVVPLAVPTQAPRRVAAQTQPRVAAQTRHSAPVVRRTVGIKPVAQRGAGRIQPGYMHGVFR